MRLYYVTEIVTETGEENACGIYTRRNEAF